MNMKRVIALWSLVLALLPFGAIALEQGRDYVPLAVPQSVDTGNKIEVREFFWYGCPHCYSLEPGLERWLKRKPANVEFVRTPATFPRWLLHARAFYAFAALNATERTHNALFRAIHEQNRRLDTEQALAEFAQAQGIDAGKFRDAFNSFGVRTHLEKAKQTNAAYQVTSVPLIAVDGKYLTGPSMTGGEEAFFAVLDQLVQKAARERPPSGKTAGK